jgi:hypothetical protein
VINNVVSITRAREAAGAGDLVEDHPPAERAAQILAHEFPILCSDIAMLVCRPFRLIWDPLIETACTDCRAEVRIAPWFFLNGQRSVGYGTAYHETSHIRHSPYGGQLLARAHREGGPVLHHILSIILDRKDDLLLVDFAPGFARTVRERLAYICTMTRRAQLKERMAGLESAAKEPSPAAPPPSGRGRKEGAKRPSKAEVEAAVTRMLKNWKPQDCYEDFFFAAKWHKSPRTKAAARAMKYLTRSRLLAASAEELMWTAHRIREVLGDMPERDRKECEQRFVTLILVSGMAGCGYPTVKLDPAIASALHQLVQQYVAGIRRSGMQQLLQRLRGAGIVYPGPISVGKTKGVDVCKVPPHPKNAPDYQKLLAPVQSLVDRLIEKLRRLDSPSEFELTGQDEGELDLDDAARIACGLGGHYKETVVERDIDAEIHLAIDCSGSMTGDKVERAKQIGIVFSEAMAATAPACVGHLWSFSSQAIYDLGPPDPASGIVNVEGEAGNSDTHMLRHVGAVLAKSRKRRKVLLVLCDDGPDDIEEVREISQQLMARGIIVVHLLVGVHGTPDIYPIELLYTSIEECLEEFGGLIETIIKNLR